MKAKDDRCPSCKAEWDAEGICPNRCVAVMRFIPFKPRFVEAILAGRKRMTCRSKPYGRVGDVLDSEAGALRIVALYQAKLSRVRDDFWAIEGCSSPVDFEAVWASIHPLTGWTPEKVVWVHEFEPLPSASTGASQ